MVHLTDTESEFAARVLVAKLGSAGILAEVRGICSPYPPLGSANVWVEAAEYADARELIVADLDDAFPAAESMAGQPPPPPTLGSHRLLRPVLVTSALLLLSSFALPRCGPAPIVHSR